uniref:Uncharacterized protein n=1 Tax=Anguilla anguilla TaxID=7936 RepID=A0A0E9SR43_ANGAN
MSLMTFAYISTKDNTNYVIVLVFNLLYHSA